MDPKSILITFTEGLIYLPLIAGILAFFFSQRNAKAWALGASIITLFLSFASMVYLNNPKYNALYNASYTMLLNNKEQFIFSMDGLSGMLMLLTAISFPIIFITTYNKKYENANRFYGLMLLAQAGLMGVFGAGDAMSFYFFWELALIPVYFLSSIWGGEKRIKATFKFFIYTFAGSLIMLVGIIYVYLHTTGASTSGHSFAINAFYNAKLTAFQQNIAFGLFFFAFAIKMPIFPFHTWQPDAYEQAPTATTMVLSAVMVKMAVYACLRWLLPIVPLAVVKFDHIVIGLSVIGMIYASIVAMKQDDLKKLVAYSSIAHIGLMAAGIFTRNEVALQGAILQMFFHGVNILGMWVVIELTERATGIKKISELGGIAHKAPVLTIFLVIIALANIALPLTNAFIGEFMLFNGLFAFSAWYAAVAGLSIILAAVYTLNMIQKVFYGETNSITAQVKEISNHEKVALSIIVVLIFMMGLYPQPMIELTKKVVDNISIAFKIKPHGM